MNQHIFHFSIKYNDESTKRLDIFLTENIPGVTRSKLQKAIRGKMVMVNNFPGKPGLKLKKGDFIEVNLPYQKKIDTKGEEIPIGILYEDNDIIVVNKPAGLVVHPAPGNESGTMVNALLYKYPDLEGVGEANRPGIVHRLDKGTSGVMVVARNQLAFYHLISQFKSHSVIKRYIVLVHGVMKGDKGVVVSPIGRHPKNRKRLSTFTRKGKDAVTEWYVIDRFKDFSLLDVNTKTGRTHQIRVHLSSIHHPVVGDSTYGGLKRLKDLSDNKIKKVIRELNRPFIHANTIEFIHPSKGMYVRYEANLPQDLHDLLSLLEASNKG